MAKTKNLTLLAINDLTASIQSLGLEKLVEEAILEFVKTIKTQYQLEHEIVSLLPSCGIFADVDKQDIAIYKHYQNIVKSKLAKLKVNVHSNTS